MARMARTARQRAALRKAQLASARKRKGRGKKKTLKQRWQKGHSGAGAIHRRRKAQWKSGRKRDKLKVIYKTGVLGYGGVAHGVSYLRDRNRNKKRRRK